MDEALDDRYAVYVRSRRGYGDPPESGEWPVTYCASHAEACKVRQAHRLRDRDCVIRFLGTAGGGD